MRKVAYIWEQIAEKQLERDNNLITDHYKVPNELEVVLF